MSGTLTSGGLMSDVGFCPVCFCPVGLDAVRWAFAPLP